MDKNYFAAKSFSISFRFIGIIPYVYLEDKKVLIQLNEVGGFILNLVNGKRKISEIMFNCVQNYEGSVKEIEDSVYDFLLILNQEGIVVFSNKQFQEEMCDD